MTFIARDEAEAFQQLLCGETHELVGWLYQWASGKLGVMWVNERVESYTLGTIIKEPNEKANPNYKKYLDDFHRVSDFRP